MSEEFNMNLAWLESINVLQKTYMMSVFEDDFDGMYKSLNLLELTISPKIEKDEVEKNLEWLDRNIDKWCVRDENGQVTKIHHENKRTLIKQFNETYRLILIKLNDKGILTKKQSEPGLSLGKLGGN